MVYILDDGKIRKPEDTETIRISVKGKLRFSFDKNDYVFDSDEIVLHADEELPKRFISPEPQFPIPDEPEEAERFSLCEERVNDQRAKINIHTTEIPEIESLDGLRVSKTYPSGVSHQPWSALYIPYKPEWCDDVDKDEQ